MQFLIDEFALMSIGDFLLSTEITVFSIIYIISTFDTFRILYYLCFQLLVKSIDSHVISGTFLKMVYSLILHNTRL